MSIVAVDAPDDLELPVERRSFVDGDVDGCWLVLACTGVVDAVVAAACDARGTWCVRADDATLSAAWVPAVVGVDDVVISVTAGRDPRRAMAVREAIGLALDTGELPLRRTRQGEGSVALVGGGPGDPGLLTVRGRQLLAAADVVVRDRLAPALSFAEDVEVIEGGERRDLDQLVVSRAREGKRVVRLTAGDVVADVEACIAAGVPVEVVPGVSR